MSEYRCIFLDLIGTKVHYEGVFQEKKKGDPIKPAIINLFVGGEKGHKLVGRITRRVDGRIYFSACDAKYHFCKSHPIYSRSLNWNAVPTSPRQCEYYDLSCLCSEKTGYYSIFPGELVTHFFEDMNRIELVSKGTFIHPTLFVDPLSEFETRLYDKIVSELTDKIYCKIVKGGHLRKLKGEMLKDVLDMLIAKDEEFGTSDSKKIITYNDNINSDPEEPEQNLEHE